MWYAIAIAVIYTIIQAYYCVKKKYFKELLVSMVIILISAMYFVIPFTELNIPTVSDIVYFIFKPLAELIFEIKK
ncbi:hypothetical protein Cst_c21550 [Thermoclostridium stercorarium subsp. stercorarium DSM 8532]|uniref:Uncharacterized protein n=1 Tax=Thermoclostridium stercorarium (strain ATCC 35414 / DSM 8532 / NCIMB 11754) TaxID=1121335 RepID=L7VS06_THES1|nr:hypothetical protein Cst_c21550 [Thermoclostridium stercorarium subsp. stercorarium DSM 8532]AGI40091.1 hypothetical protein Clst_2060 [Thermoclostridium stercorarium subsp. stercorarium DSM 8532]